MVNQIIRQSGDVAPLAGARIEIGHYGNGVIVYRVAPLAGARIEMISRCPLTVWLGSLPSRERGLKSGMIASQDPEPGRSPRGSAD